MPTLDDIAREHTDLGGEDLAWLSLLMADWQIIADLSFADLVLWLPDRAGTGFWAAGQMRPTTGPTALLDDVLGTFIPAGRRPLLDAAYAQGRVVREGDPEWRDDVPVRVETIPVRRGEDGDRGDRPQHQPARGAHAEPPGAVLPPDRRRPDPDDQPRALPGARAPAATTRTHRGWGTGSCGSTRPGGWPTPRPTRPASSAGSATAATCPAHLLAEMVRALVPPRRRGDEETLSAVLSGRIHRDSEVESGGVALILRAIPLRPEGEHIGALILVRDVTELRRRDRELVTKDATIREIHHRVKNNLQTVAALLRLQARRMDSPDARLALEEAVRRVGTIAIVHETLSEAVEEHVEFDEIADRLGRMVTDVSGLGQSVRVERSGSFGVLTSEAATALAMVLTEVLQNAVEHGFGSGDTGRITLDARRLVGRLHVTVEDDGRGLPEGFDLDAVNLGLSIVRTLVESELDGQFEMGPAHLPATRGTRVGIDVPVE